MAIFLKTFLNYFYPEKEWIVQDEEVAHTQYSIFHVRNVRFEMQYLK